MSTLYELTEELDQLQDMIDDPDCPVSTECLKDTFESLRIKLTGTESLPRTQRLA